MRTQEARWIRDALKDEPDISPLIELGASTLSFRTVVQPHIDAHIHAPLRERGVKVVHSDYKSDEGVDISGDFYDPQVRARLRAVGARAVLCCNMFEHVTDRAKLAGVCDDILAPGGLLIVTVPYSYPVHLDPIDTYFRPTPEEVARMFPGYSIKRAEIIRSETFLTDFVASRRKLGIIRSMLAGLVTPWQGRQRWLGRVHRALWLFRPYRISAVVLGKPH